MLRHETVDEAPSRLDVVDEVVCADVFGIAADNGVCESTGNGLQMGVLPQAEHVDPFGKCDVHLEGPLVKDGVVGLVGSNLNGADEGKFAILNLWLVHRGWRLQDKRLTSMSPLFGSFQLTDPSVS